MRRTGGEDLVLPSHIQPAELLVLRSLVLRPVMALTLPHGLDVQLLNGGRDYDYCCCNRDCNNRNHEADRFPIKHLILR
jgi:hypothetical protein